MSISHLLKNTCDIYAVTTSPDALGSPTKTLTLSSSPICRIEERTSSRDSRLGKDNTEATHRLYLEDTEFSSLSLNCVVVVGSKYYDVVDFENLDPILTNSRIKHIEVDLKYRSEDTYV